MSNQVSIKIWLPIIAAALVVSGVFIYSSWLKTIDAFEASQLQLVFDEKPATQVPSDWKTYRNDEYGFELKYPEGWLIEKNCSEGVCSGGRFSNSFNESEFLDLGASIISNRSLEDYIDEVEEFFHQEGIPASLNDVLISKSEMIIGSNIKAIQRVVKYSAEPRVDIPREWWGREIIQIYTLINEDTLIQFRSVKELNKIFIQILSTFKVLN